MSDLKTPEEYGYVLKNNMCLFTKGPLSNWWGGFKGQESGFSATHKELLDYVEYRNGEVEAWLFNSNKILGLDATIEFNCVEQWMMTCKAVVMDDLESLKKILAEPNPAEQKKLGRLIANWQDTLWKAHRYQSTLVGIKSKFTNPKNIELGRWMIDNFHPQTIFVEAAPWDKVWGIGLGVTDAAAYDINTWEGLNLLGECLQETRRYIEPDWMRKV